jgi:hypothetical protein
MSPSPRRRRTPAALALAGTLAVLGATVASLLGAPGGAARTQVAPSNITEPTISGSAVVGQTLTAQDGTWAGTAPFTFTYQWLRCDAGGANCTTLSGATSKTYLVQAADVGFRLRVQVRAANADGNSTAVANATPAVTVSQTGPPNNVQPPVIAGTAATFQTLTASTGLWSGQQPISYALQWLRCDGNGNNCLDIPGQTSETYVPQTADVDRTLRVRVRATNNLGNRTVTSVATQRIARGQAPLPPGAITLPGGLVSIPATSVPNDQRLIVDRVSFNPNPVRSRTDPITVQIRVRDTRGYVVREAIVFLRSTPLVTQTAGNNGQTAQDGTITYQVTPENDFPQIRNGYAVQFFVKASRRGDPGLAGVAGTRLVQVRLAR